MGVKSRRDLNAWARISAAYRWILVHGVMKTMVNRT
jgi:hypothetical protein